MTITMSTPLMPPPWQQQPQRKRLKIALAVALLAVLGAGAAVGIFVLTNSSDGWREQLGCSYIFTDESDELFVESLHGCVKDGTTYRVYEFSSAQAQENWKDVAEEFGVTVVAEGDDWIAVFGDKADVTGDRID